MTTAGQREGSRGSRGVALWRRSWGLVRLAGALTVTALCYLPLEITNPLLRRRPRLRHRAQAQALRCWGPLFVRALGARPEHRGPLPDAPFLLVSNHLSYLDIPLLGRSGGCFIAKAEIAGWPVVGRICKGVGVIFVDRGSKRDVVRVARRVEDALAHGRGVILFPEGTTGRGDALLPFRPSLLAPAARSRHPVHYSVIQYRTPPGAPPADRVVCWWNDEPMADHFRELLTLPPFTARVTWGPEPLADTDRKELVRHLRAAMEAAFEPSVRGASS